MHTSFCTMFYHSLVLNVWTFICLGCLGSHAKDKRRGASVSPSVMPCEISYICQMWFLATNISPSWQITLKNWTLSRPFSVIKISCNKFLTNHAMQIHAKLRWVIESLKHSLHDAAGPSSVLASAYENFPHHIYIVYLWRFPLLHYSVNERSKPRFIVAREICSPCFGDGFCTVLR